MKWKISDNTVFAWHSWLGLFVGIFTLFLSVTGIMLLFRDEVDASLSRSVLQVKPSEMQFPLDSIVATLKQHYPAASLQAILLNTNQANRAIIAEIVIEGHRQSVYWNPYSNQLIGSLKTEDNVMRNVLEWHEELTAGALGHVFLFLVGLAMLGSVLTGLWYYRKSLFKVFRIGVRGKNTYLFNADLHKLLGIVSCLFLLLMGGTGTFFHWEKIERMLGEEREQNPAAKKEIHPWPLLEANFSIDYFVKKSKEKK
ncbi:MAG: PepSY-associated TM helix domain-containing protein [Spirosomataceae bacterium]